MDHLREGISLRGYAQKDPKQEYKKEGYNLFAATMAVIGADVLQKIFRVVITQESEQAYQARLLALREQQARALNASAEAARVAEAQATAHKAAGTAPKITRAPAAHAEAPATLRREAPKVGRNDPCPCGSGKKYKKCHMSAEENLH
jgi:preprotein translocase subunit SecA